MLKNLVRLIFGQKTETSADDSPLPSRLARPAQTPQLPEPSARCWRRVILGDSGIATANVPLQFLLKNNLRCVKRANCSEQVIAERIRITHNFFLHHQPLLGHEIQALSHLEAEGTQ